MNKKEFCYSIMIDYNQELENKIRNNSRILKSFTPEFKDDYEFSQCWHGCDKVSYLVRKDDIGLFMVGGGGGS